MEDLKIRSLILAQEEKVDISPSKELKFIMLILQRLLDALNDWAKKANKVYSQFGDILEVDIGLTSMI